MTNNADAQIAREWASKALDNVFLNEVPIEGYRAAARYILATTTPPTTWTASSKETPMSSWYLPVPEPEYMARAWEKNPLMKTIVDCLATTDGLETQVGEWVAEYTPEENARYRAWQMQDRIRREAQLYALWLQHLDEMERHRQDMIRHNEQAWLVYRNVLAAHGRGRKTARITDLMGDTDE